MNKKSQWKASLCGFLILAMFLMALPAAAADDAELMTTSSVSENAFSFTDVPEGTYYTDAVKWAHASGVVAGTSAATFSPKKHIRRAEFVTILARFASDPATISANAQEKLPFTDVQPLSDGRLPYFYGAVAWAYKNNVASGISATEFGAYKPCTRAAALTLIYNMKGRPASTTASPFLDVPHGAYYEKAALWAYEKGISSGISQYLFGSNQKVTRAEAVTWLYHLQKDTGNTSRVLEKDVADTLTRTYKGKDYASEFDYRYFFTHYAALAAPYANDPVKALAYYAENGRYHGQQATENPPDGWRGRIVCIDPGHQSRGMTSREPIGPGSSVTKAKLTSGAESMRTHKAEYEINLEVSLKLQHELEARGYKVVMTRTTNNVTLSNIDRAKIANDAKADIFIRVHCNDINSSSVHGAFAYIPSSHNPYLTKDVIAGSQRLGKTLIAHQVAASGQRNLGTMEGNDMTGINWAQMPVTILEIGHMSNPGEDRFLADGAGQAKIARGIADGVDAYFTEG